MGISANARDNTVAVKAAETCGTVRRAGAAKAIKAIGIAKSRASQSGMWVPTQAPIPVPTIQMAPTNPVVPK